MENRKPLHNPGCFFTSIWWNDPEQRNYQLYECENPENTGGASGDPFRFGDSVHGPRTYSCHHNNTGMRYRCWSDPKKIAECPMALTRTKPEVDCERFIKGKTHPSNALVLKEELKSKFYQPDGICMGCGNCIE